jgi:acyl carrier protein
MTNKEKLGLLEEMLDIDENSLGENMDLNDVENWDSMAVISLISLLDEKFDKQISASQIKAFRNIGDILKIME